jgi:hypothetical protein
MWKRFLAFATASSGAAVALYAISTTGCGGGNNTAPGNDSGEVHHAGEAGDTGSQPDQIQPFDAGSGSDADSGVATCAPVSVTGVTFGLNKSAAPQGMCTSDDITTLFNDCFSDNPTDAGISACNEIVAQPHTPLYSCLFGCLSTNWSSASTGYAKTEWGAFLNVLSAAGGGSQFLNIGGCILAAGKYSEAATKCAEDYEQSLECQLQACSASCPVPAQTDPTFSAAENALNNCTGLADPASGTGECSKYSASLLADCPTDGGPASEAINTCLNARDTINSTFSSNTDFVNAYKEFFNLVCGPGAWMDGGVPEAGPTEGGADGGADGPSKAPRDGGDAG